MNQSSLFWAVVQIQRKNEPEANVLLLVKLWKRRWRDKWGGDLSPSRQSGFAWGLSFLVSVGGRCRSQQGTRGHGRVAPSWMPRPFSIDVIRNMKSFLHIQHESLGALGAFCLARVPFKAKTRFWPFLDSAFWIYQTSEHSAACLPQERLYLRDCPCFDCLCSVMILGHKSVHFLN